MSDTINKFDVEALEEFLFQCQVCTDHHRCCRKNSGSCSETTNLTKKKPENDYGDSVYSKWRAWSIKLKNKWQMMMGMNLTDSYIISYLIITPT